MRLLILSVAVALVAATATATASSVSMEALEALPVEQHVEALAGALDESHAAAFAVLSETVHADRDAGDAVDATTILDSVLANLRGEARRSIARFTVRKAKHTARVHRLRAVLRNLKRAAFLDARKMAYAARRVQTTEARLKRTRNALADSVQRLSTTQGDLAKLKARKMTRVRTLNNRVLDAQTRVKALKAIARAVAEANPPPTPRVFAELSERVSAGELDAVFLETGTDADADAEAEVDAASLEATAAAIIANDEGENVDEEAIDEMEELDADTAAIEDEESDEELAAEAETEAEAKNAPDSSAMGQARMMQVLQTIASSLPGDEDIASLNDLLKELITSGRAALKELLVLRRSVLGSYRVQSVELRKLVLRAKRRVDRLRARIHRLERASRRFDRQIKTLTENLKDNHRQTALYKKQIRVRKAHFAADKKHFVAARERRSKHIKAIKKLRRRLSALAASRGVAVSVPSTVLSGTYRWEASAWSACDQPCSNVVLGTAAAAKLDRAVSTRSVKCFDYSHKRVDRANCKGLERPRRTRKCPLKPCARSCVVGAWQWPKKCSNECGVGKRIAHRAILQPARYGGSCPQRNGLKGGLSKAKDCFVVKGCTSKAAKRRAFAARRALIAEQKANGTLPKKDPRRLPQPDDDRSGVWKKWMDRFEPNAKRSKSKRPAQAAAPFLTEKQKKKRAKARRCVKCPKGRAGKKCRFHNCLNKAQKQACKACAKGPDGHECRIAKCRDVAAARQKKARKAIKARKAAKKAAKKAAAAARKNGVTLTEKQKKKRAKNKRCVKCPKGRAGKKCRFHNCLNKAQKQACKACAKGPDGHECRIAKCRDVAAARQKKVRKAIKARKAAKKAARALKAAASPKKHHRRCLARCAEGKKGRKCRRVCRNRRLKRREQKERAARREQKERDARRRARAHARMEARKAREAAAAAPAPALPPAHFGTASDGSTSPEIVIASRS